MSGGVMPRNTQALGSAMDGRQSVYTSKTPEAATA
jgi:hypothetical protein